jgi:glycosyltransferase involved in cell wall biosynthesis
MKIVHISTYDVGGAANAALRLHFGLLSLGHDSKFLVLKKQTTIPSVFQASTGSSNLIQKILHYMGFPQTQAQKNYKLIQGKTFIGEPFSSPLTGIDLSDNELVKDADIINLHWVGDFLDVPGFFGKINKPVIWTLHDMNPFMGGFHYQGDFIRNKTDLVSYEEKYKALKLYVFNKHNNITVVTPSKWLYNESKNSALLKKFNHYHIPYGIDTSVFTYYQSNDIRKQFNWPEDTIILSFISDNLKCYRKGFDFIIEAINELGKNSKIKFLAIGESTIDSENIYGLGKISDNWELAKIYSQSDAVLLSSREDNLPNVLLESLACGTPVISFKVGGMMDLLSDPKLGVLAEDMTGQAFLLAIQKFIKNKQTYNRHDIRHVMETEYPLNKQATSYMNIYQEVVTLSNHT